MTGKIFHAAVFCAAVLAAVTGVCSHAHAQKQSATAQQSAKPAEGIAVVVNEGVITMSDVHERMKLIIVSSGLPNTADIRKRLQGQVLNMLIDEVLQQQEAGRANITVTAEEIEQGFATIAQQNNMDADTFRTLLRRDGIGMRTLESQIRSQIAWGKVVQRRLRPQIDISDSDIDDRQRFLESSLGKTQYLVGQIFLPVDANAPDAEVQALAQRLLREMAEQRASFPQVARQFSQEAAAARGGDLGWIQEGQLPDPLNEALLEMQEGSLSMPIRSLTGYHILMLRGKRAVAEDNIPSRDDIMTQIGSERLDRMQRRHLLDLRADAFIERRV